MIQSAYAVSAGEECKNVAISVTIAITEDTTVSYSLYKAGGRVLLYAPSLCFNYPFTQRVSPAAPARG